MSTTTIDRPRTRQPESPEERDPMEQYYGRDAWDVAKELFGEDFKTAGEFYSTPDQDIPYRVINSGTGFRVINMISGKSGGMRGFDGFVISANEAEQLSRSRIRGYKP